MKYTNRQTETIYLGSMIFTGLLGIACAVLLPNCESGTRPAIIDLAGDGTTEDVSGKLNLNDRATKLSTR